MLLCNALCAALALVNILFDVPRAMLRVHAAATDGDSAREQASGRALRATGEYVRRVALTQLLAFKADGRRGPDAERDVLRSMFALKAEQVACVQRSIKLVCCIRRSKAP